MVFAQTDQAVENFVFEPKDVFAFDMVMSSGEGKPRDERTRTTVYNRRYFFEPLVIFGQLISSPQKASVCS